MPARSGKRPDRTDRRPDSRESKDANDRVLLGAIAGPHGVRGQVRIKSFTEVPEDVAAYGPLVDESGQRAFTLRITGQAKGVLIASIEGVSDRNAAESLKGTGLYIDRDRLPEPDEDEFYHTDLIGLEARLADGTSLGKVIGLQDYGAGDLLDIRLASRRTVMLLFNGQTVPEIDLDGGFLIVDPPEGALDEPKKGKGNTQDQKDGS